MTGLLVALLALAGAADAGARAAPSQPAPPPPAHGNVIISVVGTNDLHGHVEELPVLGGYLANLRRARAKDGGAVVLLDGGDMFQGTLESNLGEGAAVVRAYNVLRYDAAAIGNHEFDFGPAGEAATPRAPGDDPRGALKARAAEARFPFLAANVIDLGTRRPVAWPNVRPFTVIEAAGVKIGIVGATTVATPRTTIAANVAGLAVEPIAPAARRAAEGARAAGASVVLLTAHAGGGCRRFEDADDLGSCDPGGEIFEAARAFAELPKGLTRAGPDEPADFVGVRVSPVDAIVAGHTHDGLAHRVAGIPIIEAYAEGRAFGRIDLTVDRARGAVVSARLFRPQRLCAEGKCERATYEGAPVAPDAEVARAIAPAVEAARARRLAPVGVTVTAAVKRAYRQESALGNLFTDLMRAARPAADVALANGGGLRADLPAGALSYGQLFEAAPFDNRFATVKLTGADLAAMIARNLGRDNGIVSLSGARATARCEGGALVVALARPDGRPIAPGDRLTLLTSDFLATGGDGLLPAELQRAAVLDPGLPIRDEMAKVLGARGGKVAGDDRALLDPAQPRLRYPGVRPVRCAPGPSPAPPR